MAQVILDVKDAIATVTVDNPPLNVLDIAVRESLMDRFREIEARKDVRVLILRGIGERAFSVGSNVRQFPFVMGKEGGRQKAMFEQELHDLLESLPQVTIAAVEGYALGGGGELMLPCDFRIASDKSVFGFPEITLGAFPCSGGTQRLLRLIGRTAALNMMLLGDTISAAQAESLGLVTRLAPAGKVYEEAENIAKRLLKLSWPALVAIKKCVNVGTYCPAEGSKTEAEEFANLFDTEDLPEGIKAFLDKRPPRFVHH